MSNGKYPSDLTDREWQLLQDVLPDRSGRGRPHLWHPKLLEGAMFYVLRGGMAWRAMPSDFPPWQTMYFHFRQMRLLGVWEEVNRRLRERYRVSLGRSPEAHAAIIDSQSVKTTENGGLRSFDGHKQVNGRKRHILVDTLGLLFKVVVHSAGLVDRVGGKLLVTAVQRQFPALQKIWADQGYTGKFKHWASEFLKIDFEVVYPWWRHMQRYFPDVLNQQGVDPTGCHVLPRRWVVVRSFARLGRYRCLAKDDETLPATEEAWCYAAMSRLLLKRLANSAQ